MEDDSSSDSDESDSSNDSDDDLDYVPENNENESDLSDASETSEIENVEQEVLEHLAVYPDDALISKDKTIQYSKQPFDANRRNSSRRNPNINSGTF